MEGSENQTARTEQHGGNTHQKRVASKATALTPSRKPVKASARHRAPDALAYSDQQHDVRQPSQRTRTGHDQDSGRVFIDARGIVEFILPRRRSEPNEDTPAVEAVAAVPGNRSTQQAFDESSPEHMRQSQCDYRVCASAHRSFRASDCTYQPYGGPRRLCQKGARPTEVPERALQVSTQTRAQQCNLEVCARFYRSFDPSDCTYQPYYGGARRTCDR
jgi:hypothetical protein